MKSGVAARPIADLKAYRAQDSGLVYRSGAVTRGRGIPGAKNIRAIWLRIDLFQVTQHVELRGWNSAGRAAGM
jgi:hypothetical protein